MKTKVASSKPLNKITGATIAGLITSVVFYLLGNQAGIEFAPEIAGAITTLIAAGVGYVVPLAPGEVVISE